jgi:hypothetical protein
MCHRLIRSQVYRALGIAMGFVGQGNQVSFRKPVLAFVRGAFPDGSGVAAGTDVLPMPEDELAAYAGDAAEPSPPEALPSAFVTVLRRVYGE